jgi:hypothetical protein
MSRYLYGGGGDGDIIKPTGSPYINSTALVYSSRTGGTQVTDLQNVAGTAVTSVTSDSVGQVVFYGPDNYIGVLWLDFGSGVRWALSPKAVDLAATRAIAVQRTTDAAAASLTQKARLPYNAADPLEQALTTALDPLVIPRFTSAATRDAAFPSPVNGDRCYRTDTKSDQLYEGSSWRTLVSAGAWIQDDFAITPTGGGFSIGSGALTIRYKARGCTIEFFLSAAFASDTVYGSGTWTFTGLPFSIASSSTSLQPIYGQVGVTGLRLLAIAQPAGANSLVVYAPTSTSSVALGQLQSSVAPGGGTWASTNFIRLGGIVEIS